MLIYSLNNVSFEDLLADYDEKILSDVQTKVRLGINEAYIPKNFQKKFKGYTK